MLMFIYARVGQRKKFYAVSGSLCKLAELGFAEIEGFAFVAKIKEKDQ